MKIFKSKLKVKYNSEIGMYEIVGESLTRRNLCGLTFYDKYTAVKFKDNLDDQDSYFHQTLKLNKLEK